LFYPIARSYQTRTERTAQLEIIAKSDSFLYTVVIETGKTAYGTFLNTSTLGTFLPVGASYLTGIRKTK